MRWYVQTFDQRVASLIGRLPKRLHTPFDILGYITPPIAWFSLILLYTVIFLRNDQLALETAFVILILLPLGSFIKFLFKRRRPPTIYAANMKIKSYSFPSSHAYSAALGGSYIASLFLAHGLAYLAAICYAAIIVIGVSRVFLGAHYPSDVTAGWLLGFIMSACVMAML